jgi:hypothetical protein
MEDSIINKNALESERGSGGFAAFGNGVESVVIGILLLGLVQLV